MTNPTESSFTFISVQLSDLVFSPTKMYQYGHNEAIKTNILIYKIVGDQHSNLRPNWAGVKLGQKDLQCPQVYDVTVGWGVHSYVFTLKIKLSRLRHEKFHNVPLWNVLLYYNIVFLNAGGIQKILSS